MDINTRAHPAFDPFERREPKKLIRNILLNAEVMDDQQADLKAEAFRSNRRLARRVFDALREQGFLDSHAEVEYWVSRMVSFGRDDRPSARSRQFLGAIVQATGAIWDFLERRSSRFGGDSSLTIEIRGRTGTGKSGMAIAIAQRLGLEPDQVEDAIHYQARPFITGVKENVKARQERRPFTPVQVMDESNLPVGEGSTTTQQVLRNEEGRLREGGITMVFNRPNVDDKMERDLTLEMVGVSEKHRQYLALAYVYGECQGFFQVPWPSQDHWRPYQEMKKRALTAGGNPEMENLRRELLEILTDEDRLQRMWKDGADEARVEFEVHDGLMAGMSVNSVRRLTALVRKGAAMFDDKKAYQDYVQSFTEEGIPYGLSKRAEEQVIAWA